MYTQCLKVKEKQGCARGRRQLAGGVATDSRGCRENQCGFGALCDITIGLQNAASSGWHFASLTASRSHSSRMLPLHRTNVECRGQALKVLAPPPPSAATPRVGARVCFTLGNKRVILRLNLARSNLYGGREAVGVKLAQLFFISLHFFSSFARVLLTI